MKKEILFGAVGVIIGVFIVLITGSIVPFGSMMRWGVNNNVDYSNNLNNPSNPVSNRTAGMMNNIDYYFIEQMIPHHEGAIAMSNIALTKATHPEIKVLARSIIEAQNKEIKDMQGWYKNWFGKDFKEQNIYSSGMMNGGMMAQNGMHMGGKEDLVILENATYFDKAFIEQMIPHHQLAIMMAQMLKSATNRPEMLTLANNIIESQSKEITQMQNWYNVWYK